MEHTDPVVDIVLPAYQPLEGWPERVAERLKGISRALDSPFHVILVDDGSTLSLEPGFYQLKEKLRDETRLSFTFLRLEQNIGKGGAVRAGMALSSAPISAFTDIDFPFTNENVVAAVRKAQDYDLVFGRRGLSFYRSLPPQRTVVSLLLRLAIKVLLRPAIDDSQCGLKAFSAAGRQLFLSLTENGFLFDLEILSHKENLSIAAVAVEPAPDLRVPPLSVQTLAREFLNFLRMQSSAIGRAVLYIVLFLYANFLMWSSFGYDGADKTLRIGFKVWSDFAATFPLIRSFSLGQNWPPEYPLYPGEPIRYHFLFQYLVSCIERSGVRIDWALNTPSIFGYFTAGYFLLRLVEKESHDFRIAVLSLYFFVFQGSLAFWHYIVLYRDKFFSRIWSIDRLSAMGPWDGGDILAFWHLNTWTNQRHFTFSLGILFAFWFFLNSRERASPRDWRFKDVAGLLIFGLCLGSMPQLHKPVFAMMGLIMAVEFLRTPPCRILALGIGAVAMPIMLLWPAIGIGLAVSKTDPVVWFPGFHLHGQSPSLFEFLGFWLRNWGLHIILLPIGFLLAPPRLRWLLLPAVVLFLVANLFRFSPDVLANHKFLNVSLILVQVFSAVVLVHLYDQLRGKPYGTRILGGSSLVLLTAALSLSGWIDNFAQKNENLASVADVGRSPAATWFAEQTPPDAVVLNSRYLYHPASVAGRKIFLGWPYFVSTAGYDWDARYRELAEIYLAPDKATLCRLLAAHKIDYFTVESTQQEAMPPVDAAKFESFGESEFVSPELVAYSRQTLCGSAAYPQ